MNRMMWTLAVLGSLIFAFGLQSDARPQNDRVELLLTGEEYDSTDLPPNPAGTWWVLHRQGEGVVLETLPVLVTSVRGCGDEVPGQQSGRTVSVPEARDPILLVRGLPNPTVGPVRTAFLDHDGRGEQARVKAEWGAQPVVVQHLAEPPSGDRPGEYRVDFALGDDQFRLLSDQWHGDGHWRVRWIGDLNRDGWPDLLIDASYKYSVYTTRLYLSRERGGRLDMREVARFQHSAC
jgi:hypothetical protein